MIQVNGGRDLSNKHWEELWMKAIENIKKPEKEIPRNCSNYDNIKTIRSETKDLNDKCIKQKNRLYRNAAIMGLVKTKKITLQDLINSNENIASKKNESDTLVSISNIQNCFNLVYNITLYIL